MTQRAGRVTCPRCGANNFETVTACWKCSAPLVSGPAAGAGLPTAPPATPYSPPRGELPPSMQPPPTMAAAPYASPYPAPVTGDAGVARRAAIALALTLPWIGLPVGWIFMMIQDRNKQSIGRICVVWSMIALVFHLLLMYAAAQVTGAILLKTVLPLMEALSKGQSSGGMGGGGGMGGVP